MKLKTICGWTHDDGRRSERATLIRVGHDFIVVDDPRAFAHELLERLDHEDNQ